ncbi:BB_0208 family protein [Borreliella carolinensis]|uniref:BB_0208 family protein n=1 Tax=Borreliella carolinensis TaxID=478174 RepID=A0ABY9E9R0_9SPIR|nr:BB_0208 family protein [Borreliella carolinensis]WKC90606.1 BB_0208 family protein [Borreliella carolinensis]WNY67539.1 BB_0208 family protein [Borreliella carolinensis]
MKTIKKDSEFYDSLATLKKYINKYIEEKVLKYSISSQLYKLEKSEIIELIKISNDYEKEKNELNASLEEYYYKKTQNEIIKKWILEIVRSKNFAQISKEANLNTKKLGTTYKLKSSNFLKLIEIQNNPYYSQEKKDIYKQIILNFSSNINIDNLERTIDILVAVRNKNKNKILNILNKNLKYKPENQKVFKSSLTNKESRLIKLKRMLILTYWPVGCLSKNIFIKILIKHYKYLEEEILALKYNEILNYLRALKTLSLNEIFYKGSSKNINFNYFFSDFTQYAPKDFQDTLKCYLYVIEKTITKKYLTWFFKDKISNNWESFIDALEYIEKHKLINIKEKIKEIITAKFQTEDFFISFDKTNFNPYESSIFKERYIKSVFLKIIMHYVKENSHNIETYGWIAFYIYADKKDKKIFCQRMKEFFKSKTFEIQNQIFVYFLSFYPNIENKHFKFISDILLYLDENKITIPKKIIKIQKINSNQLDYQKSYILIKSLKTRSRILKIILKNIRFDLIETLEDENEKNLFPAICYLIYYENLVEFMSNRKIKSNEKNGLLEFIYFFKTKLK